MMMMTAKVNIKKLLIALMATVALIIALISMLGGTQTQTNAVTTMSDNSSRVQFLESQGWQVITSPKEASQVKIPTEPSPVFTRYNELQKSQGYDLTQYAGKNVMRYVYEITNGSDGTQPVYATLLVYKNEIIGGDVTDTSVKGKVQGLKNPSATMPAETSAESSVPTE